jgi:hypothetical protein
MITALGSAARALTGDGFYAAMAESRSAVLKSAMSMPQSEFNRCGTDCGCNSNRFRRAPPDNQLRSLLTERTHQRTNAT